MSNVEKIDDDVRILAAMVYGEGSVANNEKEMYALASVLERQRIARGYLTIKDLGDIDKTFSFVTSDGNERYTAFMHATDSQVLNNSGMKKAIDAAKNAKIGGIDYSNGAYFWDGADIKTKYEKHFKVKHGIQITDTAHNIHNIKDSTKLVILSKTQKRRVAGKIVQEKIEIGRYDHVYESTAAYGGTIFWKQSDDYLKVTKAKPHL